MMSTTEGEQGTAYQLEDGELEDSDVEEGTYIPLSRPETFQPPSLVQMQIQDDVTEESSQDSSGSDSDGELRRRPKRTKLRPKRAPPASDARKSKYNIWCTAIQEDVLTEDMTSCDVSKKRQLGVESYDYTLKYRLEDNYIGKKPFSREEGRTERFQHNKRSHSDRKNVKLRLGKRINSNHEENHTLQEPRLLDDLLVSTESTFEDVGKEIAQKLNEEKADLCIRIAEIAGVSKAIDLYKETQRIEKDGGMMVMNGQRRRTSGGVYFFLLKHDSELGRSKKDKIFSEERKQLRRDKRKAQATHRRRTVDQLKQTLADAELPTLLSRGEALAVRSSEHGSNPPPSPATDAKEFSSDTDHHDTEPNLEPDSTLHNTESIAGTQEPGSPRPDPRAVSNYVDDDDDFLDVHCSDEMDLF